MKGHRCLRRGQALPAFAGGATRPASAEPCGSGKAQGVRVQRNLRCLTARASASSTGTVCSKLMQASVIDTPYCSG